MIYTNDIIGDQWSIFAEALAVGVVLGGCWDVFRGLGLFLPKKLLVIIARDFLFCIWAGFLSFAFLLNVNFGMPRGYIYFAELLGFFAWYFTVGKLNFKLMKLATKVIRRAAGFIFMPVAKLIEGIFNSTKKHGAKIKIFFDKSIIKPKKLLKKNRNVLYNKLCLSKKNSSYFYKRKAGKEHGSFETGGTQKEKEPAASDCGYCFRSLSSLFTDSDSGQYK